MSLVEGEPMPAPISALRNASIRGVCLSSISPTQSVLRSGCSLFTTPGSTTWLGEVMAPPSVRSYPTALASAPPGSRRDRSGAAGRALSRPRPYHQGMPFCANTTPVSRPSSGPTLSASAGRPLAFSVEITTSCLPRSAGLSLAFTLADLLVARDEREAPGPDRFVMSAARHHRDLVAG